MDPVIIDLQEELFEKEVLSQIRERLSTGIGEISGDELEQKLINIFRESKSLRGKNGFDERVDDAIYFFCEDLRFEFDNKSPNLNGVSLKELDDFLNSVVRPALERLKDVIANRMEHKEKKEDGKIYLFPKE